MTTAVCCDPATLRATAMSTTSAPPIPDRRPPYPEVLDGLVRSLVRVLLWTFGLIIGGIALWFASALIAPASAMAAPQQSVSGASRAAPALATSAPRKPSTPAAHRASSPGPGDYSGPTSDAAAGRPLDDQERAAGKPVWDGRSGGSKASKGSSNRKDTARSSGSKSKSDSRRNSNSKRTSKAKGHSNFGRATGPRPGRGYH